jgi:hypothetical protein
MARQRRWARQEDRLLRRCSPGCTRLTCELNTGSKEFSEDRGSSALPANESSAQRSWGEPDRNSGVPVNHCSAGFAVTSCSTMPICHRFSGLKDLPEREVWGVEHTPTITCSSRSLA